MEEEEDGSSQIINQHNLSPAQLLKKCFYAWHSKVKSKKARYRKFIVADYKLKLARKRKLFIAFQRHGQESIITRMLQVEHGARRNIKVKERVFSILKKLVSNKSKRGEFMGRLASLYGNYIFKKCWLAWKQLRKYNEQRKVVNQRTIKYYNSKRLKDCFQQLKQARANRLSRERNQEKNERLCKIITKKTIVRNTIYVLRNWMLERKRRKREQEKKINKLALGTLLRCFKEWKRAAQRSELLKNAIKLQNKKLKSKVLGKWRIYNSEKTNIKRIGNEIRVNLLSKYFHIMDTRIKEQSYQQQFFILKKRVFKEWKNYTSSVRNNAERQKKINRRIKKEVMRIWMRVVQKRRVEDKKERVIQTLHKKTYLIRYFKMWMQEYRKVQLNKDKNLHAIMHRNQKIKSKVISQLKIKLIQRKGAEALQLKRQQVQLSFYLNKLKQYWQLQLNKRENERKARNADWYRQLKKCMNVLQTQAAKRIQREQEARRRRDLKYREIKSKTFTQLLSFTRNKQAKKNKLDRIINALRIRKQSLIFNTMKIQAAKKKSKRSFLSIKKNILTTNLERRVLLQWCTQAQQKIIQRMKTQAIMRFITLVQGFKQIRKNTQQLAIFRKKMRKARLVYEVKIKKQAFDRMKHFLWKKQNQKQKLKEKQCIYLAKLLLRSLFIWKVFTKKSLVSKKSFKQAVAYWKNKEMIRHFKKLRQYAEKRKVKRQKEMAALKLHFQHSQLSTLKKVISVGLQKIENSMVSKRKTLLDSQQRIQFIALKFAKRWRVLTQLRIRQRRQMGIPLPNNLKEQLNKGYNQQRENDIRINNNNEFQGFYNNYYEDEQNKQSKKMREIRQQQLQQQQSLKKYEQQFLKKNTSQNYPPLQAIESKEELKSQVSLSPQMSFFPVNNNQATSIKSKDLNGNQQEDKYLMQSIQSPHLFEQKTVGKKNEYLATDSSAEEILRWFQDDFQNKKKTKPKANMSFSQNNNDTLQLSQNIKISKSNRTISINRQNQQQKQHHHHLNQSPILPMKSDPSPHENNANNYFKRERKNISDPNAHLLQLLEQEHSLSLIEDPNDKHRLLALKNNQLEALLQEYQTKKSLNEPGVASLKPMIQQKMLEINQLRSIL